jgi:hypothetical protein
MYALTHRAKLHALDANIRYLTTVKPSPPPNPDLMLERLRLRQEIIRYEVRLLAGVSVLFLLWYRWTSASSSGASVGCSTLRRSSPSS